MTTFPNVGGTYLVPGNTAQEAAVNDFFERCDALLQSIVVNATLSAPPGSPAEGDRHIISGSPTGDWSSASDKDMACYYGAAWFFFTPVEGWKAYDQDTNKTLLYDGSAWVEDNSGADPDLFSAVLDLTVDTTLTKATHGNNFLTNSGAAAQRTFTFPNNVAANEGVWFDISRTDATEDLWVDSDGLDNFEIPNALGTFSSGTPYQTTALYDRCRWTLIDGQWRASNVVGTWTV